MNNASEFMQPATRRGILSFWRPRFDQQNLLGMLTAKMISRTMTSKYALRRIWEARTSYEKDLKSLMKHSKTLHAIDATYPFSRSADRMLFREQLEAEFGKADAADDVIRLYVGLAEFSHAIANIYAANEETGDQCRENILKASHGYEMAAFLVMDSQPQQAWSLLMKAVESLLLPPWRRTDEVAVMRIEAAMCLAVMKRLAVTDGEKAKTNEHIEDIMHMCNNTACAAAGIFADMAKTISNPEARDKFVEERAYAMIDVLTLSFQPETKAGESAAGMLIFAINIEMLGQYRSFEPRVISDAAMMRIGEAVGDACTAAAVGTEAFSRSEGGIESYRIALKFAQDDEARARIKDKVKALALKLDITAGWIEKLYDKPARDGSIK
jgi:hypothetical protein